MCVTAQAPPTLHHLSSSLRAVEFFLALRLRVLHALRDSETWYPRLFLEPHIVAWVAVLSRYSEA